MATAQHGRRETAVLCCGLEKNGMVGSWNGHGMTSVNQTRPHCVNKMGKTHSKPLAAWHGRGTAWERHAMCESALRKLRDIKLMESQQSFKCAEHNEDEPAWVVSRRLLTIDA